MGANVLLSEFGVLMAKAEEADIVDQFLEGLAREYDLFGLDAAREIIEKEEGASMPGVPP